jgi:hypothetical protein
VRLSRMVDYGMPGTVGDSKIASIAAGSPVQVHGQNGFGPGRDSGRSSVSGFATTAFVVATCPLAPSMCCIAVRARSDRFSDYCVRQSSLSAAIFFRDSQI